VTAKLSSSTNYSALRKAYESAYNDETFVTLLSEGEMPKTSSVLGSNAVHLQIALDENTNRLIVSSAIDNLGKGAASQAIQNANVMMGLPEGLSMSSMGIPS
jgi:N-acetyl-gamma-glutamyl-phosphate reductase